MSSSFNFLKSTEKSVGKTQRHKLVSVKKKAGSKKIPKYLYFLNLQSGHFFLSLSLVRN